MDEKYGVPPIELCVYNSDFIKHYMMVLELTDYEIIKAVELGTTISDELKAYRQHARDEINKYLEGENND